MSNLRSMNEDGSPPKVTLMMVLCGLVGVAAAGSVSTAVPEDDVPRIVVHYDASALVTENGARTFYKRLESAATAVCPVTSADHPFVSRAVLECRKQAVAQAVEKIGNSRLAAVSAAHSKPG